jgi:high-affinity iron transporter
MFLNAVVLVLQEILEAALLLSVMLVFTRLFHLVWQQNFLLRDSWVYYGIVLGGLGAGIYAQLTPQISSWFDYVGQEVVNAGIHVVTLSLLTVLTFVAPLSHLDAKPYARSRLVSLCMIGIVLLSIVREGSEIMQYMGGIASQSDNFTPVLFGGIIGAGIGVSTGILLFYGIVNLQTRVAFRSALILLCLIAGNMAAQVAMLLNQADWLPYTPVVWNSSNLIPETSVFGHLLYALIGYEATPSLLQVCFYAAGIVLVGVSPLFRRIWSDKPKPMVQYAS